LGYFVGYTGIIFPDGKWVQTRKIGEETAAVKGHNSDSVSICLAGNFTLKDNRPIELPTNEQIKTLQNIVLMLLGNKTGEMSVMPDTQTDFSPYRLYPHRHSSDTECYGSALTDNWIKDTMVLRLNEVLALCYKLLELLKSKQSLAGDDRECEGVI